MSNLVNQLAETTGVDTQEAQRLMDSGLSQLENDKVDLTKLNRMQRRRMEKEIKRMRANPVKIKVREQYDSLSNDEKVNLLNKILARVAQENAKFENGEYENGDSTTN